MLISDFIEWMSQDITVEFSIFTLGTEDHSEILKFPKSYKKLTLARKHRKDNIYNGPPGAKRSLVIGEILMKKPTFFSPLSHTEM